MKSIIVCGDDTYSSYRKMCDMVQKNSTILDGYDSVQEFSSSLIPPESDRLVVRIDFSDLNKTISLLSDTEYKVIFHVFGGNQKQFEEMRGHKVIQFFLPREYKMGKYAIDFCVLEAKRLGKVLDERIASSLVSVSGTNIWFLSNEVLKLCFYADSQGKSEIENEFLYKTISRMGEYTFEPLCVSIRMKDARGVSRELSRIEASSQGDPSPRLSKFLAPFVAKLAIISYLSSKGKNKEEISDELGINRWYYQYNLHTDKWMYHDLLKLSESLANSDRMVLNSSVSPWRYLSSRLVGACLPR